MTDQPRTATIVATEPAPLLRLGAHEFDALVSQLHDVRFSVDKVRRTLPKHESQPAGEPGK